MENVIFLKTLKKNMLQIITTTHHIYQESSYILRLLDPNNQQQPPGKNDQLLKDNKKKRLNDFLYYLAGFIGLIILIIVGYYLIKKYIEKQALVEINREIENLDNLNSISAASQEERNVYSLNNKVFIKYNASAVENGNDQNNSFDFNHEERMEKIRKKYGNKMIIKILLKQQIENVIYDKNMGLEYGDNCTICVNNFIDNMEIYRTPCEHIFHKDCFNKYLKKINKKNKLICPNCNQNLLINKKFLKLRQEAEKIKVKNNKDKGNPLNINHLETEQKQIFSDNISTIEADKNINKIINNVMDDENTIPKKNTIEPVFIVKKRKNEIPQIVKKLAQKDKINLNMHNPNGNNEIRKKEFDEIYINDMNNDNIDNKKENLEINIVKIDIENKKRNEINSNLNNKKKKEVNNRIIFSEFENRFINTRLISKDNISSSRVLDENKITNNNTAETKQ